MPLLSNPLFFKLKSFNLELLPGIAGIVGLASFSTLLLKVYQTHNTTSFPYAWIFMNLSAQVLALVYGVAKGAYGIYLPSILFVLGMLYLLAVKVYSQDYPTQADAPDAEKKSRENI